jgi:hypothetical protein
LTWIAQKNRWPGYEFMLGIEQSNQALGMEVVDLEETDFSGKN